MKDLNELNKLVERFENTEDALSASELHQMACGLIDLRGILESRASQFESTLKETMKVRDELKEKLKIATEALEEIGNEQYHNRWDCDGGEAKCEIAREALDKLKKELEK